MKSYGVMVIALLMGQLCAAQPAYTISTGGTLTASGGDGTVCVLNKTPGAVLTFSAVCTSGAGGPTANLTLTQKAGISGAATFQTGDIVCIVGMNATAAGVAMGSLGTVAPSSAVLGCSVNIRGTPTGPVTATALVPAQTLVWP